MGRKQRGFQRPGDISPIEVGQSRRFVQDTRTDMPEYQNVVTPFSHAHADFSRGAWISRDAMYHTQNAFGQGLSARERIGIPELGMTVPPGSFRTQPSMVSWDFNSRPEQFGVMQTYGYASGVSCNDRLSGIDDPPPFNSFSSHPQKSRMPGGTFAHSPLRRMSAPHSFQSMQGMEPSIMQNADEESRPRFADGDRLSGTIYDTSQNVHSNQGGRTVASSVREGERRSRHSNQSACIPPAPPGDIGMSSGAVDFFSTEAEGESASATASLEKGIFLAHVEKVASSAYEEMVASRKGVTLWKVVQAMLLTLKIPSLESMDVRLHDIACLRKLSLLEGKVNTLIHCHVAVKRITSLHDLSMDICQQEGVKNIEELGLGPLVSYPLVVHYFVPPALSDVYKITGDEVLQHLSNYLNSHWEKTIQVDDFLSFVAKECSVPSPQHLCVRIQSFGMYVALIRREKKVEKDSTSRQATLARARELSAAEKGQVPSIMTRVSSFLASTKNEASSNHTYNAYLSSGDDDYVGDRDRGRDLDLNENGPNKRSREEVLPQVTSSGCPYPSAAEERARLFQQMVPHRNDSLSKSDVTLSMQELQDFIAAWKDVCREHSMFEVLTRMLSASWNEQTGKGSKKKRKQANLFKFYPAIGLLNVAVMSMRIGQWDSMYDAFQEVGYSQQQKEVVTEVASGAIEVYASQTRKSSPHCQEFTVPHVDQVLEQLKELIAEICRKDKYVVDVHGDDKFEWKYDSMLKAILKCEKLLAEKFSVKEFSCLGFGEFSEFVEHHWNRIIGFRPGKLMKSENADLCVASVPLHRMKAFVSQVLSALDDKKLSEENILKLMCRQFGSQSMGNFGLDNLKKFLESTIVDVKAPAIKSRLYFSAALLAGSQMCGDPGMLKDGHSKFKENSSVNLPVSCRVGAFGSMDNSDALQCLQKAPMLCDLSVWSQWDAVFAPTLGPLIDWLERWGTGELEFIVTCDGAVIRIDGSATVDEFLVAAVNGFTKRVAVELVSLLAVYGGAIHAPQALLKAHASKAIDIHLKMANNVSEITALSSCGIKRRHPEGFKDHQVVKRNRSYNSEVLAGSTGPGRLEGSMAMEMNRYRKPGIYGLSSNKAVEFVLGCIFHAPSEFRPFIASVLFPALSVAIPDAATSLLSACSTIQQRSMLHGIGIALGICDLLEDYHSICIAPGPEIPLYSEETIEGIEQGGGNSVYIGGSEMSAAKTFIKNNITVSKLSVAGDSQHGGHKVQYNECDEPLVIVTALNEKANIRKRKVKSAEQSEHVEPLNQITNMADLIKQEKDANDLIKMIRQEEFGLDLDLHSNEHNLLAKQHARIGRALQCLSRELYSQDSHFVLELVQNADDNSYTAEVEAALVFVVQNNRIVILNNEVGFSAANMKALCDVGNSTKAGSSTGYIGHKGIGFKSVFRVTDAPEIHSKGFHVKFDISEGNLGFILPTIVSPISNFDTFKDVLSCVEKVLYHGKSDWNTCIVVPLKSSVLEGPEYDSLVIKFNDIHPSLLLFLHRLRCIAVKNDLTGSLRIMRRQDLSDGLVRVVLGDDSATWLVVRRELEATVTREGVQSTEIAMAFPLQMLSCGEYEALCEHQQVFAFLPLRSYGLKFIVQGDFILPSSREEVDCDNAWNQWLLSEIPDIFCRAVDAFKELPGFRHSPGKAATSIMRYVPLEGEVQGFFSPLPHMILAGLRAIACLAVEDGDWFLPCMVLGGWDDFSRRLLPDVLLKEHLGLRCLHRDVVINPFLAASLGVHMYGANTLVGIMRSICAKKGALERLGPHWIGCWLVALHKCMSSHSHEMHHVSQHGREADVIEEIKFLPFIPLSNGTTFTSVKEGPVWLPYGVMETSSESTMDSECFPLLYSALRIVHPFVLHPSFAGDDISDMSGQDVSTAQEFGSLVYNMLQQIGVGKLLAHDIMITHVMPIMASDIFMEKEPMLLLQYLAFIKFHLESDCRQCKIERSKIFLQLQKMAIIVTNNGYKRIGHEPVHSGIAFGCPFDVKMILEGTGVAWNEVDAAYLKVYEAEGQSAAILSWRKFLLELGITDFAHVLQVEKVCNKSDSIWKDEIWEGDDNDLWLVKDWECPELITIISEICGMEFKMLQRIDKCSNLLSALDKIWDDYYSHCRATYTHGIANLRAGKETEASFILWMRSFPWVCSSLDGELHVPTDLFHRCSAVEAILGNHAAYAVPQVESNSLAAALGLRTDVSVNDVLDLLKYWSECKPLFEASIGQMLRMYTFLWSHIMMEKEYVLECFRSQRWIFLPTTENVTVEQIVPGNFFSLDEVCWSDETGSLDLLLKFKSSCDTLQGGMPVRALGCTYGTMHGFFVSECHVRETLNFKQYLTILRILSKEFSPSEINEQAMSILRKWSEDIELGQVHGSEVSAWKELLEDKDNSVLPTIQNRWVSLHRNTGLICWCDNEELGKQFIDSGRVFYLPIDSSGAMNPTEVTDVKAKGKNIFPFLQAMNIPALSEVVEKEPDVYGAQNSILLWNILNWTLPYAQRYLRQLHLDHYKELQQTSFGNYVKGFQCIIVRKLYFRYTLPGRLHSGKQQIACNYLLQGNTLYATQLDNLNSLFLEFSKLFFRGKSNMQLANFLHLIMLSAQSGSQEREVEALIVDSQGIFPLPDGEPVWTIESVKQEKLNEAPSQGHLEQSCAVKEPIFKKHNRSVAENVWPPRSWLQPNSVIPFGKWQVTGSKFSSNTEILNIRNPGVQRYLREQELVDDGSIEFKAMEFSIPVDEFMDGWPDMPKNAEQFEDTVSHGKVENVEVSSPSKMNSLSEDRGQVQGNATFRERERLIVGQSSEQQQELTGRIGEALVFKYLVKKHGAANVRWLNENAESGSSYDLVVCEDGQQILIEVKATKSGDKDWFEITQREWDLAMQKGEHFVIIRVFLPVSSGSARLLWLPNPAKLCQDHIIKLAILLPQT